MSKVNYYKNRIILNCLCGSVNNGEDILTAMEGHALIGFMASSYSDQKSAVLSIRPYQSALENHISIGLGSGNADMWKMVAEISEELQPEHISQIFSAGGFTRKSVGKMPMISSMMSPCGSVGMVKISTGPLSSQKTPALVPVETAIAMAKEQGADSLKYFPMNGLKYGDEYKRVSEICAKENFALEPTGGITLKNLKEILQIPLSEGVPHIIPHVYSSIINEGGETDIDKVDKIYQIFRELL